MWCELLKLETVKQNMSVYVSNLLLWYWHLSSVQSFVPWMNFHNLCQHICIAYVCSVRWLKHHEQQAHEQPSSRENPLYIFLLMQADPYEIKSSFLSPPLYLIPSSFRAPILILWSVPSTQTTILLCHCGVPFCLWFLSRCFSSGLIFIKLQHSQGEES